MEDTKKPEGTRIPIRLPVPRDTHQEIVCWLRNIWWALVAILAALALMQFMFVKYAKADPWQEAAVVCEDDYEVLRYALADGTKRKVLRAVKRCWRVSSTDGSSSTARLEDLLDAREDEDEER